MEFIERLYEAFLGDFDLRIAPLYLSTMLLIAMVVYRVRVKSLDPRAFLKWLFPKDVYLHPSHIVDLKIFVVGRLLVLGGLFNVVVVRTAAVMLVSEGLRALAGSQPVVSEGSWANTALVTLVFFVVTDFCTYWVHRIHHENPILWPFHALHHSAEVMSPITVYRKHPIYDLISSLAKSVLLGAAVGLILFFLTDNVSVYAVGQANIAYVIFNLLGSNFRHTHIWISYGPVLERLFISPAQHQVHHSIDPRHHNKNYGEILAIWDWMFGTLYVPHGAETLAFGLSDAKGNRIAQPHGTLTDAMVAPFRDSWRAIRRRIGARARAQEPAE